MKRIITIFCMIILAFSLVACGKKPVDEVSQKIIDDINSIGEVTLDDADLIAKITSSYATLTDAQKEQVSNYKVLLDAQDEIEKLQAEAGGQLKEDLKVAVSDMYDSAALCEDIIKEVDDLWDMGIEYVNMVYSPRDPVFNNYSVITTRDKISDLEEQHELVLEKNAVLINWPSNMSEEKAAYDELYSAYLNLYELASSPSGNHINYVSNASDRIDAFVTAYKKISPYLE